MLFFVRLFCLFVAVVVFKIRLINKEEVELFIVLLFKNSFC